MVYSFKVGPYARKIYLYGTERFTARDGYAGIPEEYWQPVKQYAANNFTREQIDDALAKGYINQQEYDDTVALITTVVVLP
ncbi:hypothetical protein [Neobacillus niacini]|uniref:hypothetical protein n=1 Tax=Neobacillus niacini TaxID=86668 RepID=UPI002859CFDD|nr:hypothetical protein [Neobacillus niacini]MDR7001547.1 hypothetical protein [Neobacillus niacini]